MGDLIHVYKSLIGGVSSLLGNQSPLCGIYWKDKRHCAQTERQRIPFKHKEKCLFIKGDEKLAHRLHNPSCGVVILGDTKNLTACFLHQSAVVDTGQEELSGSLTISIIV